MIKFYRIGHHNANRGVITIASDIDVDDNKIWYGTAYCSPKEPIYYKKLGNELALDELLDNKGSDMHMLFYQEFTHTNILKAILQELYYHNGFTPSWASNLIAHELTYPTGLKRYEKDLIVEDSIIEVVVNSQFAKNQLLLALNYINGIRELNTSFIAVNELIRLTATNIIVRE